MTFNFFELLSFNLLEPKHVGEPLSINSLESKHVGEPQVEKTPDSLFWCSLHAVMRHTQALLLLLLPMSSGAEVEEDSKMDWEKTLEQLTIQYFKVVPSVGTFSKALFKTLNIPDRIWRNSHPKTTKTPNIHENNFMRI